MGKLIIDGCLIVEKNNTKETISYARKKIYDMRDASKPIRVKETTELGEAVTLINDDTVDSGSRMSGIDFRARLHPYQVGSIIAIDILVALKTIPVCGLILTRLIKRNSVSINGEGRKEHVDMVAGKQQRDSGGGVMNTVKSWFGGGGNKNNSF